MRKHCRQLDAGVEASEPHDFSVRDRRIRRMRQSRPSHPAPNVRDDRDTPLIEAQDAGRSARDLPDVTSECACGRLTRRANHVLGRQGKKTDVNRQSHRDRQLQIAPGAIIAGFFASRRSPGITGVTGHDGNDARIKCDFRAPIAQKHWKNRGRRQKIAKNPEKNCVEASCSAQGAI